MIDMKKLIVSGVAMAVLLLPCLSLAQNGEMRRDTFKQIELEMEATKSSAGQLVEKINDIKKQSKNLKTWKYASPDRLEKEYADLLGDYGNAMIYARNVREQTDSIQKHIGRTGQFGNQEADKKYDSALKATHKKLDKTVQMASNSPLMKGNQLLRTIKGKVIPEVAKAIQERQKKIERLKLEARASGRQSKNLSKVQTAIAQIGIFAEILENQLALARELLRIYAQAVGQHVGVTEEFHQALGDPAWLPETSEQMVNQGWETAFMVKDLLAHINDLSFGACGIDEKTAQTYEKATEILREGENKTGQIWE